MKQLVNKWKSLGLNMDFLNLKLFFLIKYIIFFYKKELYNKGF